MLFLLLTIRITPFGDHINGRVPRPSELKAIANPGGRLVNRVFARSAFFMISLRLLRFMRIESCSHFEVVL